MTPPVLPSEEVDYVLSPQLPALGEALALVTASARRAMARRRRPSGEGFLIPESLSRHARVVSHGLSQLELRTEGLISDVIHNKNARPLDVGRSVGRLEQVVSELIDGYLEAKAARADTGSAEARTLILGVYRHHIRNVCNWMDDLVAIIANPEAAALRGRDLESSADRVVLTVRLDMTSPPEMARLFELIEAQHPSPEECAESPVRSQLPRDDPPGVFDAIGALAVGLSLSEAVFGRKDK